MDTVERKLNAGWKFCLNDCEQAWYKGFDDSSWETVYVPHDWSVTQPFSEEYSSGTGYAAGGIGWYRLHFSLPEQYRGKCVRIVFDGIYKNSQVWCNSFYLGKRPNGYTTFSYDLTSFARFGEEENVVSVRVSHTDLADSRWFTGSGITREVSLLVEEAVHPAEYGVFFETKRLDGGRAHVKISHALCSAAPKACEVSVTSVLADENGKEALCLNASVSPDGWGQTDGLAQATAVMQGEVVNPALWSVDSPHLYKLRTFYSVDGGTPYLVQEEAVGIRTFSFDPDRGFFLNGENLKIKGVCVHHDGGCLGAAMRAEVWQRRLEILKECGCNAIRCSHNPHMPRLYALCDRMGFLMMDEAFDEWENAKNKWSRGHNVYPPKHQGYFEDFPAWHEADLRAMVRRDRNHPSVILWSIGNEIDYPNDPYCHPMFQTMTGNNDAAKPAVERAYDPAKPDAERLRVIARRLAAIVRSEDGGRPVTLAAAFPELSSRIGFLDALNVAGYNYKEHLYEEDHRRFPGLPLLGSENGHSYEAWRAVRDNPFISGQFLWTGIDYLGEAHGWPVRGSMAGLLTCAGDRKPEFYKRKSFWTQEPVLAIAARRDDGQTQEWLPLTMSWDFEPGEAVIVKCFSNLSTVSLYINGRPAGAQTGCGGDGAFTFCIPFEKGVLLAEGTSESGVCVRQELVTPMQASRLSCEIWRKPDILTGKSMEEASGEKGYLYQLSFLLTDESGRAASGDDRMVEVWVSGDGELAGMESGDLSDVSSYALSRRRTCQGHLTVYVRRTGSGPVFIRAKADISGGRIYEAQIH